MLSLLPPQRLHHYRVVREAAAEYHPRRKPVAKSTDVFNMFRAYCAGLDREHFIVVALDTKNQPTGWHVVSIGTLNSTLVHPREIFRFAILSEAHAVMFVHNHPSGDPTPSEADDILTARLVEAGKILGVQVLDHVIIGSHEWYSYADHGRIRA